MKMHSKVQVWRDAAQKLDLKIGSKVESPDVVWASYAGLFGVVTVGVFNLKHKEGWIDEKRKRIAIEGFRIDDPCTVMRLTDDGSDINVMFKIDGKINASLYTDVPILDEGEPAQHDAAVPCYTCGRFVFKQVDVDPF